MQQINMNNLNQAIHLNKNNEKYKQNYKNDFRI